jgi:hypothetical protein
MSRPASGSQFAVRPLYVVVADPTTQLRMQFPAYSDACRYKRSMNTLSTRCPRYDSAYFSRTNQYAIPLGRERQTMAAASERGPVLVFA